MVISNIRDMLTSAENPDLEKSVLLKKNSVDYINKMQANQELEQWSKLIKIQFTELKTLLEVTEVSPPSGKGPSTPPNQKTYENFHKFSPLVDETSKLRCSVSGCKSKFGSKWSYQLHMRSQHPDETIDYSKEDPLGKVLTLIIVSLSAMSRMSKYICTI